MDKIYHDDQDSINELFVGRKVVAAHNEVIELDDGTEIKVIPNEGCGGCEDGWFYLRSISEVDNVITSVEVDHEYTGNGYTEVYKIVVYAEGVGEDLVVVEGSEGNGYYGTGFSLKVTR